MDLVTTFICRLSDLLNLNNFGISVILSHVVDVECILLKHKMLQNIHEIMVESSCFCKSQ